MPLKVIQGHRFLVQIDFLLVINTNLLPILHRFRDSLRYIQNRYIWLPLLRLIPPPMEGFRTSYHRK